MSEPLEIVIVGGGTAGWLSAIALANFTNPSICKITLVESEEIGSVGVGEATLPQMKEFNDHIGINESDMMQNTNATIKLGIEFVDWGTLGNSYIHPFGKFGEPIQGVDFHQAWARVRTRTETQPIGQYSYAIDLALKNRFEFPVVDRNYINSTYSYAYHFDASLYAKYLRKLAEEKGVIRKEGKIQRVINSEAGDIIELELQGGEIVSGDFFIDCSGFRSLLLGQNLKAHFEDWSKWLVCDRAVAVQSEKLATLSPYTQSIAKEAGWQWRIPLQHRTGNGYVYSSHFSSDEKAKSSLLSSIEGNVNSDPKVIKFKAGRYKNSWEKNCLAVGLSSGFLEPLESTSIYLIQVAILNFLKLFPSKKSNPILIQEYNRLIDYEYERVRDFLILHYKLNQRTDSELWQYCREMDVPDSLKHKMELFKRRGFIDAYRYGLFAPPSWISVFVGQGLYQENFDPFLNRLSDDDIINNLESIRTKVSTRSSQAAEHEKFLESYCPSKLVGV